MNMKMILSHLGNLIIVALIILIVVLLLIAKPSTIKADCEAMNGVLLFSRDFGNVCVKKDALIPMNEKT